MRCSMRYELTTAPPIHAGRCSSRRLQTTPHNSCYLHGENRFNKIFVESRGDRFLAVSLKSERCHGNHTEVLKSRFRTNSPDEFVSVKTREHNIRDNSGEVFPVQLHKKMPSVFEVPAYELTVQRNAKKFSSVFVILQYCDSWFCWSCVSHCCPSKKVPTKSSIHICR